MPSKKLQKDDSDIGVFYLCVHKRLHDKVGLSGMITHKNFCKMLGEVYHIPKVLRVIIIKEMVKLNMIKEINHNDILVKKLITDPEINISRFYEEAGLWDKKN